MSKKRTDPLSAHGELLSELAVRLVDTANDNGPWDELYYDMRCDADCSVERFIVRHGEQRAMLRLSPEGRKVREDLWHLRNQMPKHRWFGLFVRIIPNGEVEVSYSHDQECIETLADDEANRRPL
jgi:hypothetical protein